MYLVSFLILSLLCLCRGDLIVNQFGPVLDEIFYADSYDRVGSTPAYMMIAADDFLVPPTYSMTINSVLFSGHFISGSYSDRNVRNFTVLIYGDTISTTFPGYHVPDTTNLIASQVQIPTTVTYPSMTMNVSFVSPPTLQSGQYWVGIYANMKGPALTYYFNIDRLQTSTTYGERFVSKESDATFYPDAYENKWVPYNESTMFKPGYFGRGGYNLAFNIYGSITDSTPPTVSSFLFSPTSFDFIIGKMMNFSVTVSDNVGVKAVEISLQSPNQVSDVFLKLGSGNSTIGNWIYSTNFAFDPTSGNWSIIKIDVVDYAGNWKNYTETEIRSLFGSYHSFTVSNGLTSTASSSSSTTALTSTSLSTSSTTATTTSSTLTSLSTTTTSATTLSSSTSSFSSTSTLTTAGGSTSTSSTTGTTGTTATTGTSGTTGTTAKATTGTTATTVEGTTTSGITSTTSVSSTTSDMLTTISTSSATSSPSMNSSDVNNIKSASSSSAIIPIIGAVGGFIVLVAIGLILFFVFRRKRSKNASKQEVPSTQVSIGNYNNFNSSSSSVGSLYMPMSESRSTTISQNPSRLTIIDPLVVISYAELKIENEVGNGAYGIVFRGTWRGGAVAIKQINGRLTPKQLNDFKLEASIMKNLRPHVNVVQFLGVTLHPDPLCLITEFLDQGSLYLFLRKNKLDSKMIMNIVKGIASGMLHLHSEGLIHRDLAARNILLGSGQQVKISDFGMSRHNSEDKNHTKSEIGPLKWMAPESIRDRIYSTATDVWSYGVTVWEIVTKEDPFSHLDSVQAALAVVHDNLRLKIPDNTPFVLAKVINLCFNIDPAQRPSFESILSTLQNATIEEWSFT